MLTYKRLASNYRPGGAEGAHIKSPRQVANKFTPYAFVWCQNNLFRPVTSPYTYTLLKRRQGITPAGEAYYLNLLVGSYASPPQRINVMSFK